jgi:four helix bundle protein
MEKFWKLKVFQKAHRLILEIYKVTRDFPDEEKFGLVSQMRRSAVSVVANIVEATKRKSQKDRNNFHIIAISSLEELKYYLFLSYELKYINHHQAQFSTNLAREVGAMLNGLIKSINNKA